MYIKYYQLSRKPFEIDTDPAFLHLTEQHRKVLATLKYGITESKSFLLLTGDAGVGKTVMTNALLATLGEKDLAVVIDDAGYERLEFLNYIASSFGLPGTFVTKGLFIKAFHEFLSECRHQGKRVVLIVDQCHDLSDHLLGEIRLLSNLELNGARLISVFLVGRPEFVKRLECSENRGIRQKITVNCHLEPLNISETTGYIEYRMSVAGSGRKVFEKDAISEIYKVSGGNHRLINVIADHALLIGSTRSCRYIGKKIVTESVEALDISKVRRNLLQKADKVTPRQIDLINNPSYYTDGENRSVQVAGETSATRQAACMDKVLIIDDDTAFLNRLKIGLDKFQQFEIYLAGSKNDAISILDSNRVSILVFSADSPLINAIDLLSYMSRYYSRIPCIAMVARKKPWFSAIGNKKTFLYYIEKPVDINVLASAVIVGLNQWDTGINVNGLNMASVLPMFELLGKTGALQVGTPTKKNGNLFFTNGRIDNARYGNLEGEAAAREIASWSRITFDFSEFKESGGKPLDCPALMALAGASWHRGTTGLESRIITMEALVMSEHKQTVEQKEESLRFESSARDTHTVSERSEAFYIRSLFEKIRADIQMVKGYNGLAFFDDSGNLLWSDEKVMNMDLAFMAEAMARFYVVADAFAANIDLDDMNALTLHAKGGHVLVRLMATGSEMTLYAMVVCAFGGNWFYLKSRLEQLASELRDKMPANMPIPH